MTNPSGGYERRQERSRRIAPRAQPSGGVVAGPIRDVGRGGRAREQSRVLSPVRIMLFVAILVALALIAYAVFMERGGAQIPILTGGLALMGLALLALSLSAARAIVGAGRAGSGGRAFGAALFGGVCALGAAASLASAVAFGLIWSSLRS